MPRHVFRASRSRARRHERARPRRARDRQRARRGAGPRLPGCPLHQRGTASPAPRQGARDRGEGRVNDAPSTTLRELQRLGQSPWLDNITRGMLTSGLLAKLIRNGDVTGLTSNPTIFEQAISKARDYDEALAALVRGGRSVDAIVDALTIEDIQAAADQFKPVYQRTKRADGYVSIEISPDLATDAAATIREAARIWRAVNRPNLMVKIPATAAGIPAITATIAAGINVNVTLIFSIERYREVMQAYLDGLTRRLESGLAVDRIA